MVTYDGTGRSDGITLYLDGRRLKTNIDQIMRTEGGRAQLSGNTLAGTVQTTAPLTIGDLAEKQANGTDRYGGKAFEGQIDEVRIYSRVLDPSEITRHYKESFHAIAAIAESKRSSEQADLIRRGHQEQDLVEEQLHQQRRVAIAKVTDAAWDGLPDWTISQMGLTLIRLPAGEFVDPLREGVGKNPTVDVPRRIFNQ